MHCLLLKQLGVCILFRYRTFALAWPGGYGTPPIDISEITPDFLGEWATGAGGKGVKRVREKRVRERDRDINTSTDRSRGSYRYVRGAGSFLF